VRSGNIDLVEEMLLLLPAADINMTWVSLELTITIREKLLINSFDHIGYFWYCCLNVPTKTQRTYVHCIMLSYLTGLTNAGTFISL
jgi:hypothetical protein